MRSLMVDTTKVLFYLIGAVIVCIIYVTTCSMAAAFVLLFLPISIIVDIFKYIWRLICR